MVKRSKSKPIRSSQRLKSPSVWPFGTIPAFFWVLTVVFLRDDFLWLREQEQESAAEEEVQDHQEGEGAPQEEGQGGEEAGLQPEAQGREGPRHPQRLAVQGAGAQGPRRAAGPRPRGIGGEESRPQRKGNRFYELFQLLPWSLDDVYGAEQSALAREL